MATCNECIYRAMCYNHEHFGKEDETTCEMFRNKADYAEVKHGYWKDRYGNKYYNHLYECSVCGKKALYEFYANELGQEESRQALTPTCPHCGAKMDGERRTDDE